MKKRVFALAPLCQFLAARSILGVAIRPLKPLTAQAKRRYSKAGKARASRPWSKEGFSRRPRRTLHGRLADLADRVTEWTESRNWTESTETYEAKRSALVWLRTARVLAESLLFAGATFGLSSCEQPAVLCTCGRGDFAAVYTLIEGPAECGGLKSEILGMNAYSPETGGPNSGTMADWDRPSVAIGSERIGWLIDRGEASGVSDMNKDHKLYAIGDFPKEPTAEFCAVPTMRAPDAEIDMPAIPAIPDDPTTMDNEARPPVDATHYKYKWTDVKFLVTPAAIGTQMTATLEFTQNTCTARYRVKGVYPARNCESRTTPGQPDKELCSPVSQPDKEIYEGSGISPDFPVDCVEFDAASPGGAKRFYCMLTKDVPAFK